MICANCGHNNPEGSFFCMKCGHDLAAPAAPPPIEAPLQTEAPVAWTAPPGPVPSQVAGSGAPPRPTATPIPQPSQTAPSTPPTPRPAQPQPYTAPPAAYNRPVSSSSYPPAISDGQMAAIGFWGPFAGYGTRRRHIGWLLDNRGEKTAELIEKVTAKFNERSIPSAQVERRQLVGRGVIVEARPYFLLRKGLVTLGVHITQFGKDLFISLASYLKPPISNFRVILLGISFLFFLYTTFILPNSITNALGGFGGGLYGQSSGAGNLGTLLCVVGPLGALNSILLFIFIFYSIFKYVSEKDLLAGLRVKPNEFNEDDLMALEKATEQTVRISMDEIGLNPNDLKPVEISEGMRII